MTTTDLDIDPLDEAPTAEIVHWQERPPAWRMAPPSAAVVGAFLAGALTGVAAVLLARTLWDD
ncbi:MAG TPA: hypothetical protein VD929_06730 [Caulobacteraceae bacterium]|nr:hypothetical protein [Caulobacteraceae bacterium]